MSDRTWMWWLTTALGGVGAALGVIGPEVGGTVGDILLKIAAMLTLGLGATHSGRTR